MWKFVFGVLVGAALYHEWVWAYLEDHEEPEPECAYCAEKERLANRLWNEAKVIDSWPDEIMDQGAEGSSVGYAMARPMTLGRRWFESFDQPLTWSEAALVRGHEDWDDTPGR